jgi:lysophospholipase L1-like esterase
VTGGCELLISLYSPYDSPVSVHPFANSTQYRAEFRAGDRTYDRDGRVFIEGETSTSWLDAVDLFTRAASGAIVVLGDSMSDRSGTTVDTFTGWTDLLGERLAALAPADPRRRTVVTAGIGGNTLAAFGDDSVGPPGLARLERDVFSQSGTTDVMVFEGTNDLLVDSSAAFVIRSLREVAQRCKGSGMRSIASTLLPRGGAAGWDDAKSSALDCVNAWLRTSTEFDAVLDFGTMLAGAADRIKPDFDADGTHPNQVGHRKLAESVDLDLLVGGLKATRPDRGTDQVGGHAG